MAQELFLALGNAQTATYQRVEGVEIAVESLNRWLDGCEGRGIDRSDFQLSQQHTQAIYLSTDGPRRLLVLRSCGGRE